MDAYTQRYYNQAYDADASIAKQGVVNNALLAALCENEFLQKAFQKQLALNCSIYLTSKQLLLKQEWRELADSILWLP